MEPVYRRFNNSLDPIELDLDFPAKGVAKLFQEQEFVFERPGKDLDEKVTKTDILRLLTNLRASALGEDAAPGVYSSARLAVEKIDLGLCEDGHKVSELRYYLDLGREIHESDEVYQ